MTIDIIASKPIEVDVSCQYGNEEEVTSAAATVEEEGKTGFGGPSSQLFQRERSKEAFR